MLGSCLDGSRNAESPNCTDYDCNYVTRCCFVVVLAADDVFDENLFTVQAPSRLNPSD